MAKDDKITFNIDVKTTGDQGIRDVVKLIFSLAEGARMGAKDLAVTTEVVKKLGASLENRVFDGRGFGVFQQGLKTTSFGVKQLKEYIKTLTNSIAEMEGMLAKQDFSGYQARGGTELLNVIRSERAKMESLLLNKTNIFVQEENKAKVAEERAKKARELAEERELNNQKLALEKQLKAEQDRIRKEKEAAEKKRSATLRKIWADDINYEKQLDKEYAAYIKDIHKKILADEKKLSAEKIKQAEKTAKIQAEIARKNSPEYLRKKIGESIQEMAMGSVAMAGLSYGFINLSKSIMQTGIDFEQYKMKLTAITGSTKEATDLMVYMKDYAAKTPFDVKELVAAGTTLRVYDHDIKTMLPRVAALASAMNRDVPQAALAFGRAMKGSTYGFRMLRESFGVSTEELAKFGAIVKDGKLILHGHADGVERVQKALTKLVDLKYGNMIEMQGNTAKTALSNIGDALTNLKDDISKDFLPILLMLAKNLIYVIDGIRNTPILLETLKTALSSVAIVIGPLLGAFSVLSGGAFVLKGIGSIGSGITGLVENMHKLSQVTKAVEAPAKIAVTAMNNVGTAATVSAVGVGTATKSIAAWSFGIQAAVIFLTVAYTAIASWEAKLKNLELEMKQENAELFQMKMNLESVAKALDKVNRSKINALSGEKYSMKDLLAGKEDGKTDLDIANELLKSGRTEEEIEKMASGAKQVARKWEVELFEARERVNKLQYNKNNLSSRDSESGMGIVIEKQIAEEQFRIKGLEKIVNIRRKEENLMERVYNALGKENERLEERKSLLQKSGEYIDERAVKETDHLYKMGKLGEKVYGIETQNVRERDYFNEKAHLEEKQRLLDQFLETENMNIEKNQDRVLSLKEEIWDKEKSLMHKRNAYIEDMSKKEMDAFKTQVENIKNKQRQRMTGKLPTSGTGRTGEHLDLSTSQINYQTAMVDFSANETALGQYKKQQDEIAEKIKSLKGQITGFNNLITTEEQKDYKDFFGFLSAPFKGTQGKADSQNVVNMYKRNLENAKMDLEIQLKKLEVSKKNTSQAQQDYNNALKNKLKSEVVFFDAKTKLDVRLATEESARKINLAENISNAQKKTMQDYVDFAVNFSDVETRAKIDGIRKVLKENKMSNELRQKMIIEEADLVRKLDKEKADKIASELKNYRDDFKKDLMNSISKDRYLIFEPNEKKIELNLIQDSIKKLEEEAKGTKNKLEFQKKIVELREEEKAIAQEINKSTMETYKDLYLENYFAGKDSRTKELYNLEVWYRTQLSMHGDNLKVKLELDKKYKRDKDAILHREEDQLPLRDRLKNEVFGPESEHVAGTDSFSFKSNYQVMDIEQMGKLQNALFGKKSEDKKEKTDVSIIEKDVNSLVTIVTNLSKEMLKQKEEERKKEIKAQVVNISSAKVNVDGAENSSSSSIATPSGVGLGVNPTAPAKSSAVSNPAAGSWEALTTLPDMHMNKISSTTGYSVMR